MPGNDRIAFVLAFLLLSFGAFAQKSRNQLENEKEETLRKIRDTEQILNQTASQKKSSIGQLQALNEQINARWQFIESIDQEIDLLNREIGKIHSVIEALEKDLEVLKKEYGEMAYASYKATAGFNNITFLFSARTFNQFFMRLKYMEQYTDARKNQVKEINIVKDMLSENVASIENKNKEKLALRERQENERRHLVAMKKKQNQMIGELQNKETELKKEIAQRNKAVERLDAMISDIVRREMELARKASAESKGASIAVVRAGAFENAKSKLDWPVSSGFISSRFGLNPHPVFKGITETNDGISIQTNKDETVNVVFDGTVSKVALAPPPFLQVVLVQHGEYFTVYSKLSDVYVKAGQTVKAGQRLGRVYTDKNGVSEVHFMVWKNVQKLNPQDWLVKK